MSAEALASHAARRDALARAMRAGSGPVGLAKETSNLFRDRHGGAARRRLDVRSMRAVLGVDRDAGRVDAEGMATYESLVAACLPHGVMPAVVPQLKTITLGGAVAGVGIEASSHRHGLVHETVERIEVLTGEGEVVTCTAANEHADLFFGFPNSYGTLGYALRVVARAVPVKPFVRLEHLAFRDPGEYFHAVERHCAADDADFIDGTLFAPDRLYLTLGRFAESAPYASDYTGREIYYRSIAGKREDWLTVHDFLWRWDTDWFWCSKNLLAQNPLVRALYGRKRLGSRTYTKIMRWNSRVGLTRAIDRLRGLHGESVIQDVDVPIENAPRFLAFLAREVGIWPVWMCPIGPGADAGRYALYPMQRRWYVNFGFWDVVKTRETREAGHCNRAIERAVAEAGGIKSLYSDSYFSREELDARYGGEAYAALKARYDPRGAFPTLYEKCVLRR
ncbi:MAG TPA: FAD-binding oxidoreductase [Usitatibacter sp.]|nr:FAD-binding oxidoreductase [Usitatibacter sp.]